MWSDIQQYFMYVVIFAGLYFQVFLLVSYFLWDGTTEFDEEDVPSGQLYEPTVSVLVPCWNEEKTVVGTVNSLLGMDYPREKLNIIVIDDGSTDSTWQVVQIFANNPSVTLLHKENEGSKFAALNFGLHHVTSEIVGCLDADSSVHPQALRASLREFTKPGVMAVVPSMVIDNPKTFFQWMQKVEYEIATYAKQAFSRLNTLYIAPGPFTLFRKKVFDELGEYTEAHHVEDMEIALRMQIKGMRISHAIDSLVYTKGPRTWRALLKQRVRWTYGFIMNVWDYKWIFFKDNLGHVGVTIPFLFAMLIISLAVYPILIIGIILSIIRSVERIGATHDIVAAPHFSLFYINTSALTILGIITIVCLLFTLAVGRKALLKQDRLITLDLLTLIVYSFFAAWWTIASAWNAVRNKKKAWR